MRLCWFTSSSDSVLRGVSLLRMGGAESAGSGFGRGGIVVGGEPDEVGAETMAAPWLAAGGEAGEPGGEMSGRGRVDMDMLKLSLRSLGVAAGEG